MKNDNLIKEGSVIISIKEYDHLREFKNEILKGNAFTVWEYFNYGTKYFGFATLDDFQTKVLKENQSLHEGIIEARRTNDRLYDKIEELENQIKIKDEFYKKHLGNRFWNWIFGK